MNFYEENLRKIFDNVEGVSDVKYIGRTCYATLNEEIRMKAEFVTMGTHEHYEALKVSIIAKNDGEVDSNTIRFEDVWGKRHIYMGNNTAPYMWVYNGKAEWYTPEPSKEDFTKLSNITSDYIGVFGEQNIEQNEGMSEMGM